VTTASATTTLNVAVERIVREFDPVRIVLFGSRARNEGRPDSDFDLLVVLDEVTDKRAQSQAISRALHGLGLAKDVVVTDRAEVTKRGHIGGTVLRPALREGVTLYRRSTMATAREESFQWLRYALEDLAVARLQAADAGSPPRHACFNAQQAAEKALKAALVLLDFDVPKSHNLDALRDALPGGWRVQSEFPDLEALTDWIAVGRYPGAWPEATRADATAAVELGARIVESVVSDFRARGVPVPTL
jgi:uncharacterized protein